MMEQPTFVESRVSTPETIVFKSKRVKFLLRPKLKANKEKLIKLLRHIIAFKLMPDPINTKKKMGAYRSDLATFL